MVCLASTGAGMAAGASFGSSAVGIGFGVGAVFDALTKNINKCHIIQK